MTSKEINKDTIPVMGEYDVIVVGAGHAGCEAGLISARMGMNTLLLCINLESVAMMPCNPSIGGTGKGHLVCEIDALGGEMGLNIDKTFLQSKMLNTSKGPAVHSLRAQADKTKYHLEMKKTIEKEPSSETGGGHRPCHRGWKYSGCHHSHLHPLQCESGDSLHRNISGR